MRYALILLFLLPITARAQLVPNGGVINGQVWSNNQWNGAWQSKVDNIAGVCANCTITNPTITAGTWSGGIVNVPTAPFGDSTTQAASTAFVAAAVSSSGGCTTNCTFTGSTTITGGTIGGVVDTAVAGPAGRTLSQHFNDTINVMDRGAKCDGSTSDTTTFQAALNAASGKSRVYVPNTGGVCMVGALVIPSNTTFVIDGSVKLISGSNNHLFGLTPSGHNITIEGTGKLDGNGSGQTGSNGSGCISDVGGASYVWVRGLTITNCKNWPVNLRVQHGWMSHLVLSNSGNSVEFTLDASDCWADHLYISNIQDYNFAFYGGVSNCGISDSYTTSSTISGIVALSDAGQPGKPHNIVIHNNVVTNNNGHGIELANNGGSGSPYSINITNNRITGNGTGNVGGNSGIKISFGDYIIISGNNISQDGNGDAAVYGISIDVARLTTVSDNLIGNEGQGGTNGIGIHVTANGNNVNFVNNKTYDDQATKTMAYSVNGTAGNAFKFLGNDFTNSTIGQPTFNVTTAGDTLVSQTCAANTVSLATLVISAGFVTHC